MLSYFLAFSCCTQGKYLLMGTTLPPSARQDKVSASDRWSNHRGCSKVRNALTGRIARKYGLNANLNNLYAKTPEISPTGVTLSSESEFYEA